MRIFRYEAKCRDLELKQAGQAGSRQQVQGAYLYTYAQQTYLRFLVR